ncbi:PEP-CTERM sorting domain-containing protein [Chamaesiphon sp. OTE_20_metabat_361]|uniref:PEP-CTERM sorting domain-containing protein n=1 Tax=Chamaesiphon sp. OTE_20_metabat_361 TaxID=2964689 RepID=UPI00286ACA07|nr:PEP-CTERM sorting domain-containing protein [Chamaesiphon sp. OTE_20_metabat_361]
MVYLKLQSEFLSIDGDTATGDFDFNDNTLLLNSISFGNFSSVNAQNTTAAGVATGLGFSGGGFRDDTLDTGFFTSNDALILSSLFTSLGSGNVVFGLRDVDLNDNFFDFTQGIDSSLINVGTGPVITPPGVTAVPEPFTIVGTLIGATAAYRTRKRLKATNKL